MAFIHKIDVEADELVVQPNNRHDPMSPYGFSLRNRGQWVNAGMFIPCQMELSRALDMAKAFAKEHNLALTVRNRYDLELWQSRA